MLSGLCPLYSSNPSHAAPARADVDGVCLRDIPALILRLALRQRGSQPLGQDWRGRCRGQCLAHGVSSRGAHAGRTGGDRPERNARVGGGAQAERARGMGYAAHAHPGGRELGRHRGLGPRRGGGVAACGRSGRGVRLPTDVAPCAALEAERAGKGRLPLLRAQGADRCGPGSCLVQPPSLPARQLHGHASTVTLCRGDDIVFALAGALRLSTTLSSCCSWQVC